jgi:hypothetical protein
MISQCFEMVQNVSNMLQSSKTVLLGIHYFSAIMSFSLWNIPILSICILDYYETLWNIIILKHSHSIIIILKCHNYIHFHYESLSLSNIMKHHLPLWNIIKHSHYDMFLFHPLSLWNIPIISILFSLWNILIMTYYETLYVIMKYYEIFSLWNIQFYPLSLWDIVVPVDNVNFCFDQRWAGCGLDGQNGHTAPLWHHCDMCDNVWYHYKILQNGV